MTVFISSVKLLSCVQIFVIPWTAARLPCPSPTPGAWSNSYTSSWWCHPTMSSLLSSSPPAFSLPKHQYFIQYLFIESALCIRWPKYWSFSFSISPSNEYQDWYPLGWTGLISLKSKGLPRFFSNTTVQKYTFLWHSAFFMVQLPHPYMTTRKTIALTWQIFVSKVISLLFNMLSRLVIAFLPRSMCLLISWLQSHLQWF